MNIYLIRFMLTSGDPVIFHLFMGIKFFLIVIDDFNHYIWIFLMKSKAETKKAISNFINMIQN